MLKKLKHVWVVILVLALVAATVTGIGIVAAEDSNDTDVITACIQKNNGMLRIVDDCDECRKSELCESWRDCDCDALSAQIETLAARVSALELEGQPCDDEDLCTENDIWVAGVCTGGTPVDCDDGNQCTLDSCDPEEGCKNVPQDGLPCDDGDACTVGDECAAGVCTGGTLVDCDDFNPCTDDSCDPATGCINVPAPEGTQCDGGECDGAGNCIVNSGS